MNLGFRVTIALLLATTIAFGQQAAIKVSGRVIDGKGAAVRDASVGIEGSDVRVKTDQQGQFKLSAAVGATLVVEHDGHDAGFAIVSGETLDDILLLGVDESTEVIEISGEAPAAAPGAAQLDRTELQRVPGTGGDIVRALTVMPGVVNLQIPLGYSGVVIHSDLCAAEFRARTDPSSARCARRLHVAMGTGGIYRVPRHPERLRQR